MSIQTSLRPDRSLQHALRGAVLLAGLTLAAVGLAGADEVLDQSNEQWSGSMNLWNYTYDVAVTQAQHVVAGVAGRLTRFEVLGSGLIYDPPFGEAEFFVNVGEPPPEDEHDFTAILEFDHEGWFEVDISAAQIDLEVGDSFCIGATGLPGVMYVFEGTGMTDPRGYPHGTLWTRTDCWNNGEWYQPGIDYYGFDLIFHTYMETGAMSAGDWAGGPVAVLGASVPNPFRSETTIHYELHGPTAAGRPDVHIYDAAGRLVNTLSHGSQGRGLFSVSWDGTDYSGRALSSGVYYYELEWDGVAQRKRVILVK